MANVIKPPKGYNVGMSSGIKLPSGNVTVENPGYNIESGTITEDGKEFFKPEDCFHKWVQYKGFRWDYEYCEKCDLKKQTKEKK